MNKINVLIPIAFSGAVLLILLFMKSDMMNWGVVSVLGISVGVFILSRFVVNVRKGSQRTKWPSVPGEIIGSEVKEVISYGENRSTDYFPIVRYRYTVNLVEYEGDVISASEAPFAIGTDKYAKSQVAKYPTGNKVDVFYNPDNPAEAVLKKSGADLGGMLLLLVLGLAVLACGLAPIAVVLFK